LKSFFQNDRLTDSDLTKRFFWGETGSGATGLPYVDGYVQTYQVLPYWVSYEIDYIEPTGMYPVRIGPFNRCPGKTLDQTYFANMSIGGKWATGEYQIVWKSRMTGDTGVPFVIESEPFSVISAGLYDVHGVTGPVQWCECVAPYTGGELAMNTRPYDTVGTTHNATSRYEVVSTSGEEVWVTSNAPVYSKFSWARYGSVLVVSQKDHDLDVGDRIILRSANVDYQSALVTTTTIDSFSLGVADEGFEQGFDASYSKGFTFTHNGSPKTGGTLSASSEDIKLMSIRIRTGERAGTTYLLELPVSAINNESTSLGTTMIPVMSVRQDADNLSAIAATMSIQDGSYSNFLFANLGNAAASRIINLLFG